MIKNIYNDVHDYMWLYKTIFHIHIQLLHFAQPRP
jgi:hypothetical protein